MAKLVCNDILHNDCPVVFEGDDQNNLIVSYQMHAIGSHGARPSTMAIKYALNPNNYEAEISPMKKVPVDEIKQIKPEPVTKKGWFRK